MKKWYASCAVVLLAGLAALQPAGVQASEKVVVIVEVVADSNNHINAQFEVQKGTNAREVMERLFKMEYQDVTRRFVTGIAGFQATSREKKFWKLEIEGEASPVGIADVKIERNLRLRWIVTSYK